MTPAGTSNKPDVQSKWEENTQQHTLYLQNDTTPAVSTRRGAHENTYGMRNRRRNVYASLEVWVLWLCCLNITTIHFACDRPRCLRLVKSGIHALHPLDLRGVIIFFPFNLTYSRWTSSLPCSLWSRRIFPSLPGSRLTIFYRDASSALLQLVNQWLNFTCSRSHAFRYERKNTNPTLVRIELTNSALAGVEVTY